MKTYSRPLNLPNKTTRYTLIQACECGTLARGPKGGVCGRCVGAILSDDEVIRLTEKPKIYSNAREDGSPAPYGSKSSGQLVRTDLRDVPGETRAERRANLRAAEKQRLVTFKHLSQQKGK